MSQWFIVLLSFVFIVSAFTASNPASEVSDDMPTFVMPFYGLEKKWSRREPSIRFFKRSGQPINQPSRFTWDN